MNLNPEQKKAVEHADKPLMIVAGAGTGKTRVIIHRIAYLINSKQVAPENIVALTYSKKAAEEMKLRLEKHLKIPLTEMHVSTFHAFCTYILQEYGYHIGISPDFDLIDDTMKKITLRRLFPGLKLRYYLEKYDPRKTIDELSAFIARAKDELIYPSQYAAYTKRLRREFERTKNTLAEIERETKNNEVQHFEESGVLYEAYQNEIERTGVIDFGGQIMKTCRLFTEKPAVLKIIQNRFTYILVDEFQDTNVAQIELMYHLAKHHKNINVVGDDDQAIYRFRGASYASFQWFRQLFPECAEIMLRENYRSTKNILACSVISIQNNNMSRLFSQKVLTTHNKSGAPVRLIQNASTEQEARSIADILQIRMAQNKSQQITGNTAVLYRAHNHCKPLLKECIRRGIPFKILTPEPLFGQPEIKLVLSFMRLLDDTGDNSYFYTVLQYPEWQLSAKDITALFTAMQMQDCSPIELLQKGDYRAFLSPDAVRSVNRLKKTLLSLHDKAKGLTAVEICQLVFQKALRISNLVAEPSPSSDSVVRNSIRLHNFIFENAEKNADQSLRSFLQFLDYYVLAGGDPATDERADPDPNGINFLTVHAAKGLEFDSVFIIRLTSRQFPLTKRNELITFPKELMKEEIPGGDVHKQEERRLFYVAITRARNELFLSTIQKKRSPISSFVKEIIDDDRSRPIISMYNTDELHDAFAATKDI